MFFNDPFCTETCTEIPKMRPLRLTSQRVCFRNVLGEAQSRSLGLPLLLLHATSSMPGLIEKHEATSCSGSQQPELVQKVRDTQDEQACKHLQGYRTLPKSLFAETIAAWACAKVQCGQRQSKAGAASPCLTNKCKLGL